MSAVHRGPKRLMLLILFAMTMAVSLRASEEDSLLRVIKQGQTPARISAYNRLAEIFRRFDADSSMLFAQQALNLSANSNDRKGMGTAYNHIGNAYYFKGNYPVAIEYHQKSFLCRQQEGDTLGMANSLNNIGVNYRRLNDYEKALDYYLRSLELKEQLGNKSDIITALNNIGGVYYYQRNFTRAGDYYRKALGTALDIHDSEVAGAAYNNLSLIYDERKLYDSALVLANQALSIRERINDPGPVAVSLNNIGRIYEHMENFARAFLYYRKAVDAYRALGDIPNLANTLYNIGNIYLTQKDYKQALDHFQQSLDLSRDIDNKLQLRDIYHGLAFSHHGLQHHEKAFDYMKRYIDLNDSIYDEESMTKISEMEVKYQSEKKIRENEVLKKENELNELTQLQEQHRQRYITYAFIAGLVVLLFIAGLLLNRNQIKQRAHRKLEAYNMEVLRQKEETDHQKKLVDEKNKEIIDSILYARRIQEAMLPSVQEFEFMLPGSFVFYRPKDIVSGDFYWMVQKEEYIFFAAVDCTGHGVPGGFMSMMGSSLLNEVINQKKTFEPADILDVLRLQVILALKQKGISGENKDGMDMALCRINKARTELLFAGANNGMYLVRNGVLQEYRPDKQPIGIAGGESRQFTQHSVPLSKGDNIYIFTDGYADQFGGPNGKKFKYSRMEKLLTECSALPANAQKAKIESAFDEWKNGHAQVDDVCMVGLKI
jgi:serine phosphatase RsbU (regulator of sigma subunit)